MRPAIRVENLSKCYRIGGPKRRGRNFTEVVGDAAKSAWSKVRRLADSSTAEAGTQEFWALKDVSFEVPEGEVVGIIGRNGAGKSTLLKILSRIVEPTSGGAEIHGRLGSLLEVGTGFNPELTGRENIYLNGSILGMKRREIAAKFDEIVAFSEVEQFLDTPVKRYSSGMYVRLAFAVAAHLEPEVLIVDEVLAVGDAAFQAKCMGKMRSIAEEGRTILFVSHNPTAIRSLSTMAVLLKAGHAVVSDDVDATLDAYVGSLRTNVSSKVWDSESAPRGNDVALRGVQITTIGGEICPHVDYRKPFQVRVETVVENHITNFRIGIEVRNSDGIVAFGSSDYGGHTIHYRKPGKYVTCCTVPGHTLNSGTYTITVGSDQGLRGMSFLVPDCVAVEITDPLGHGADYQRPPGIARPHVMWETVS